VGIVWGDLPSPRNQEGATISRLESGPGSRVYDRSAFGQVRLAWAIGVQETKERRAKSCTLQSGLKVSRNSAQSRHHDRGWRPKRLKYRAELQGTPILQPPLIYYKKLPKNFRHAELASWKHRPRFRGSDHYWSNQVPRLDRQLMGLLITSCRSTR